MPDNEMKLMWWLPQLKITTKNSDATALFIEGNVMGRQLIYGLKMNISIISDDAQRIENTPMMASAIVVDSIIATTTGSVLF